MQQPIIKITHIQAAQETKTYLVLIPGGPGLSSLTLRSLDILKASSHLLYIDLQGTNETFFSKGLTYENLVQDLSREIKKVIPNEANLFIIGHSFGGFFAASLAFNLKVNGIFCLATPFSKRSLDSVNENYHLKGSAALIEAEKKWLKEKDNDSFKKWLSEYGEMYFLKKSGKEMLLQDNSSADFFISNRSDASQLEPLLEKIATLEIIKVFIIGDQDGLLSIKEIKKDASEGRFQFFIVENASHFLMFDQPEKVSDLIISKISL